MKKPWSLGLKQVQSEFIMMDTPGCYWVTATREEDGRTFIRQVIASQQALTLISSAEKPQRLLQPVPAEGPDRIPMYSLKKNRKSLLQLSDDLMRIHNSKSGLMVFYCDVSHWNTLSGQEISDWLKKTRRRLITQKITLLILTTGFEISHLRNHLQHCFRQLDGAAHIDHQQDSWQYRISWWNYNNVLIADRAVRLTLTQERFTALPQSEKNQPLSLNDENNYIAEQQVLEGAPPLSKQWLLYESNAQVFSRAQQASTATVIFSLARNEQINELAEYIHGLRLTRGSGLKIVLREMQTSLRYSDERLLLACGVNVIVPHGASLSRFLSALEGIQGQIWSRHIPGDLTLLKNAMQPLQERGYLSLDAFCDAVRRLVSNTVLPENGKGLLVALRPVPGMKAEQLIALCKPRRYGDLATLTGQRICLFLSSCRYSDLDTALRSIFRLPHDEIFSNRLVWFEDAQILTEISQMNDAPGAWHDLPLPTLAPVIKQPVSQQPRIHPQPVTLLQNEVESE
ncbi:cellulose biosynthesis protein [Duffyella gerundensis]|uniref:Cellulose biosynthesis protein BcsE n=1 Tax=Duffyella gerundensis TaxID=1619313 RepID=A0A0U5LA37_9GAMM|nr:cellulose biosynthesis protein BcsE [Duffyella gerundensis]CUU25587.1 cellulose biosynthesis protein [Duffyella gerundensis]